MTVFTLKKEPLNENTVNYSEMFSKRKKLSLEREVLLKIWVIFRGDTEKRISGNFAVESILKFLVFLKLKTERNFNREVQNAYMPTLPDYPGVSRIRNESPGLPYGSLNLPDKNDSEPFTVVSPF